MSAHPILAHKVFCAPGRNETYKGTFRGLIRDGAAEISSVDFTHEFGRLAFAEQVGLFRRIIEENYWSAEALLLGRSFGAWILLNALVSLRETYPGTVVSIASVLGSGGADGLHFITPRNQRFWDQTEARPSAPARRLVLLHAVDDVQCPCALAVRLCQLWGAGLVRFKSGGHGLGARTQRSAVTETIERIWLG